MAGCSDTEVPCRPPGENSIPSWLSGWFLDDGDMASHVLFLRVSLYIRSGYIVAKPNLFN